MRADGGSTRTRTELLGSNGVQGPRPRSRAMLTAIRLLNTLLPLAYAIAVAAYGVDFVRDDPVAGRAARRMLEAALILHVALLGTLSIQLGHVPLASPAQMASSVALSIAFVYLLIERRTRVPRTGVFILSLALCVQIGASAFLEPTGTLPELLRSPLFAVHTVSAVVGYAAFGVSASYGVLYLLLHRALKRARFGLVFERLPPLEVLVRMSAGAAKVGVAMLTLTIVCGSVQALAKVPGFVRDPKFLLTIVVWALYLGTLVLRRRLGWRDRRTVAVLLVAFALLLAAALTSTLVVPSFHVFR